MFELFVLFDSYSVDKQKSCHIIGIQPKKKGIGMSKGNTIDISDSVGPAALAEMIDVCIDMKRPLMIWAGPGVGKSDIVAQAAKKQNRPLIDIRLPLLDITDVRGIPYLAEVKVYDETGKLVRDDTGVPLVEKEFRWSNPSDLPVDQASRALVFYDEISAAPPSVQAATYQMILNRRIGNYQLPEQCAIIAAGNRLKDQGVSYKMPTPLRNRFTHVTLQTTFEDWKMWAMQNRIHRDVVGYICFQPNDLNSFGENMDSEAFATPRSWEFVSKFLQTVDDAGNIHEKVWNTESTLTSLVNGTVGASRGLKFMKYREQAAKLPNPDEILTGKLTELYIKDIGIVYSLITSCIYRLIELDKKVATNPNPDSVKKLKEMANTYLTFILKNFERELAVMGCKGILGHPHQPTQYRGRDLPIWKEYTKEFAELIV